MIIIYYKVLLLVIIHIFDCSVLGCNTDTHFYRLPKKLLRIWKSIFRKPLCDLKTSCLAFATQPIFSNTQPQLNFGHYYYNHDDNSTTSGRYLHPNIGLCKCMNLPTTNDVLHSFMCKYVRSNSTWKL